MWLWVTGESPTGMIDHIDRNPVNDRFDNLRIVTLAQNIRNSRLRCDNTSGVRGVYYHPRDGIWTSQLQFEGQKFYLGSFKTKEEAQQAWTIKARELDPIFYGV